MQPAQPRLFMLLLLLLNAVSLSAIPVDKHLAAELAFNRTADQLAEEILHSTSFLALEEAQPIAGTLLREHINSRVRKELLPAHAALGSALEAVEAVLEKEAFLEECPALTPNAIVEDNPQVAGANGYSGTSYHYFSCICTAIAGKRYGFGGSIKGMHHKQMRYGTSNWKTSLSRSGLFGMFYDGETLASFGKRCQGRSFSVVAEVVDAVASRTGASVTSIHKNTRVGLQASISAMRFGVIKDLKDRGGDPEEIKRLEKLDEKEWATVYQDVDNFAEKITSLQSSLKEEITLFEAQFRNCVFSGDAFSDPDCDKAWSKLLGLFGDCSITLDDIKELFDPSKMVPFSDLPEIFNRAKEQFHALQGIDAAANAVAGTMDGTFTDTPFHTIAGTACAIIWETIDTGTAQAFDTVAKGLKMVAKKCPALRKSLEKKGKVYKGNPALAISVAIQGAAGASGSVAAVEVSAAAEGGVAISLQGQRMCFVGACVGGKVGASIGAKVGAGGSLGVALSIVGEASMLAGTGSSVGVSIDGSAAKAIGFTAGLDIDFLVPDAVNFRALDKDARDDEMQLEKLFRYLKYGYENFEGLSIGTELGAMVGVGATVGAGVTFGLCWTPVCITEAGNGCGMIYSPDNPDEKEMCAADPCSKTEISKKECAKKKCGKYQGSLTSFVIARQSDAFPCEETWALAYSDLQKKMIDDHAFGKLGKRLKRKIAVSKCKDGVAGAAASVKVTGVRPKIGDTVLILSSEDSNLKPYIGQTGRLIKDDQSDMPFRVKFSDGEEYWFRPHEISMGDDGEDSSMERYIRRPGAHHLAAETEALEEALDALSDAIA